MRYTERGDLSLERYSEEMKLWLFDLAHGNLNDEMILKGFIKHYVLHNLVIDNIVDDIHFHTFYGTDGIILAKESILRVLNNTI